MFKRVSAARVAETETVNLCHCDKKKRWKTKSEAYIKWKSQYTRAHKILLHSFSIDLGLKT